MTGAGRHGTAVVARGAQRLLGAAWRAVSRGPARFPRGALPWAIAVIVSFIAFGTADTVFRVDVLGWGLMPFVGALVGAPLGFLATRPLPAWATSAASAALLAVVLPRDPGTPWPWLVVHGLVVLTLLFGVSVRGAWAEVLVAWAGTSLLFAAGVPWDAKLGWVVAVTTVAVVGVLVGRLVVTNVALARQTRRTADEKARRLVLEERARIARDLHDVVAHHMSLIVVQAETAGYRRPGLPDAAREELDAISAAAREALTETRALLTVLRRDGEPAAYAPQPGIGQLEELCRTALRAGVPLEWTLDVPDGGVRRATSLAAYRIVQEALANAARHAPGAAVRVQVSPAGDGIHIRVENGRPPSGGPGPASPADPGAPGVPGDAGDSGDAGDPRDAGDPGHGIVGMREHAAAQGGTLTAGPTADGGFRVEAWLGDAHAQPGVPAGGRS